LRRISDFIRSFRLEQIIVVYSVLLFGVFATSHTPTVADYLKLALLSICGHIFGYGLNDVVDKPYDRFKPLHRGQHRKIRKPFSRDIMLTIVLLQLPIILCVGALFYGFGPSTLFILLALASIAVYDLFGKISGRFVLIPHIFFPLSLALLCLGGYTLFDPVSSIGIPFSLLLVTLYLNSFLANSVQAGLYDLKGDQDAGVSTVAIWSGSQATGKYLRINRSMRLAGMILYFMNIPVILVQAFLNGTEFWIYGIILGFFLFGYIHLVNLLKIKNNHVMLRYDVIGSSAYLFYATSLCWIERLPWPWWLVIAFNFLYPFVRNHPNVFGRWTLISFFRGQPY